MDPRDLPTVTDRGTNQTFASFRRWWAGLNEDPSLVGVQEQDYEAAMPGRINSRRASAPASSTLRPRPSPLPGTADQPTTATTMRRSLNRADAIPTFKSKLAGRRQSTAVLQTSAADKFLGTAASSNARPQERLPPLIVHPLSVWYRWWWNLTVLVAAITSILEPYVIAFTPPGLYPYNSGTSIVEFTCMVLIVIDMLVSFNVARYVNGELVTSRRQLSRNYLRLLFWVDLSSVIPFDEIALAIAGLNGPDYLNNPELAQYLSLLKLIRFLRMYRLAWFFSYLTYNLASPLLVVTLLRNLFYIFFLANLSACAFYYEALQAGLGPNTWVGANSAWFSGATTSQMYIYSLYWSMITLSTTGYGDIRAYNPVEAGLIAFWVLFLMFFGAYIVGSITLLVVKNDERVGKYREQMRALQGYSTMHSLPHDLRDSMQRHLKLHFYNADAADEAVLKVYPSSIRRRVLRQLYLPTIRNCYLFSGAKPRFIDAILSICRVELYLPGVEVISQGDYVNDLFILVAGRVACAHYPGLAEQDGSVHGGVGRPSMKSTTLTRLSRISRLSRLSRSSTVTTTSGTPDGSNGGGGGGGYDAAWDLSVRGGAFSGHTKVLEEGDVFGEVAFFTATAQIDTVTTMTACRVLSVPKQAYEQLAATFPTSQKIVLLHLARHGEDEALDLFPGPQGLALFQKAMSNEKKERGGGGGGGGDSGLDDAQFTGGDPTWRLTPGRAASLKLTSEQERSVGALLQVKGVVTRAVAKHDADRTTEWLYAATRGDLSKLREMLGHGFHADGADYDQRTALMLASCRGFRDVVDALLDAGANPNVVDTFGNTALTEACKGGHDDVIDALRKAGASLGVDGGHQASILCNTVFEGDLKLLLRYLRAGADVNAVDYDGRSALHVAASKGNVPAVEVLVSEGANMKLKDRWGNTPIDDARRVGAKAVEAFLKAEETEGLASARREQVWLQDRRGEDDGGDGGDEHDEEDHLEDVTFHTNLGRQEPPTPTRWAADDDEPTTNDT